MLFNLAKRVTFSSSWTGRAVLRQLSYIPLCDNKNICTASFVSVSVFEVQWKKRHFIKIGTRAAQYITEPSYQLPQDQYHKTLNTR